MTHCSHPPGPWGPRDGHRFRSIVFCNAPVTVPMVAAMYPHTPADRPDNATAQLSSGAPGGRPDSSSRLYAEAADTRVM